MHCKLHQQGTSYLIFVSRHILQLIRHHFYRYEWDAHNRDKFGPRKFGEFKKIRSRNISCKKSYKVSARRRITSALTFSECGHNVQENVKGGLNRDTGERAYFLRKLDVRTGSPRWPGIASKKKRLGAFQKENWCECFRIGRARNWRKGAKTGARMAVRIQICLLATEWLCGCKLIVHELVDYDY